MSHGGHLENKITCHTNWYCNEIIMRTRKLQNQPPVFEITTFASSALSELKYS
jgi:hypothetical protein